MKTKNLMELDIAQLVMETATKGQQEACNAADKAMRQYFEAETLSPGNIRRRQEGTWVEEEQVGYTGNDVLVALVVWGYEKKDCIQQYKMIVTFMNNTDPLKLETEKSRVQTLLNEAIAPYK